ncbi:MAG TPA: beta-propeller fold lactonase family protein [Burkholderiaceae bacterium]|nr:beta-propeller fold lactonase family protein [Burkholderiaceae bacterium]
MEFLVIVSCADSGELHALDLTAEGDLRPRQVLELGGMLMPVAVHPRLPLLYVARRSDPMAVLAVTITAEGDLELVGDTGWPVSAAYLACDRSGSVLLSASYPDHCVTLSRLAAQGLPEPPSQVLPTGRHAHCAVIDPSNRHVYATSLGADRIHRYTLHLPPGRLEPAEVVPTRPGAGPRHLVFDREGTRLYLLNELDAGLDVYAREPGSGELQHLHTAWTVPDGWTGSRWAAELRLDAEGRRLFATERRSSTLSVFTLDPASGLPVARVQVPTEEQPRGMQVSPDGRHVLVAGQQSHHVSSLAIPTGGGMPRLRSRIEVGRNPNWVEILPLAGRPVQT